MNEEKKLEEKLVFLDIYWGRLEETVLDYGKGTKVYLGNFFQRLFHIGPCEIRYLDEPKTVTGLISSSLNASVVVYDSDFNFCDLVYFGNYRSRDKAIEHLDKDEHDESIRIKFDNIDPESKYLLVVINSFSNVKIEEIPTISLDIYPEVGTKPIINQRLVKPTEPDPNKEAIILAAIYKKDDGEWYYRKIDKTVTEKNLSDICSSPETKKLLKDL